MNSTPINGILLVILCTFINPDITGVESSASLVLGQDQPSGKCRYSRAYKLLQVDCTSMDFKNIPENLNTDIQVLVLNRNRLKILNVESLATYSHLAYLYLQENFLWTVPDSIKDLPYLEVIDVSENLLHDVSPDLFQLPYLRKLYLMKNELESVQTQSETNLKLEFLDLSENHLSSIPSIGKQPVLTHLNLSSNDISHISTEDVAPFCSLKTLDLTSNPITWDPTTCDCHLFNSWMQIRNFQMKPVLRCNNDTFEACRGVGFSNETITPFESCKGIIETQMATARARSTWIIVASCIALFMVCLIISLFCVHKKNKKRKKKALKNSQMLVANNANTELLNSNLPDST